MKLNKTGQPRKYKIANGAVFGKLTLIDRTDKKIGGSRVCHWKCECGRTFTTTLASVHNTHRYGGSKGCPRCVNEHRSKVAAERELTYRTPIIEAYVLGKPVNGIADKFGISKTRVLAIVGKYATPEMIDAYLRKADLPQLRQAVKSLSIGQRRRVFLAAIRNIQPKGKS